MAAATKKRRRESAAPAMAMPPVGISQDIRKSSIVQVNWRDARSDATWQFIDAITLPPLVTSVGFLVANKPSYISLALSVNVLGHVGDVLTIPRGWVKKVKVWQRAPGHKREG